MMELWQELQRYLTVASKTSYVNDQAERPVALTFTVANSASPPSPNGPEIVFEDVKLYIRTESDGEVVKELGRLGPRESAAAEHRVSYRDLVQLTHRVVGRVSPETFLTVASEGSPRQDDVNMPVEGYVTVLEEANLHKWLHGTLNGFQAPGPDTTLGDLKKQSQALSESMGEIRSTRDKLQKLSALVTRGRGREAIINHSRQVTSYLEEVDRAIGQLCQILESSRTETVRGTLDHLIPRLEQSATRLGQATEALKQEFLTTARPVQKEARQHNPGTQSTAGGQDPDPSGDDDPGRARTPNDDRSDSLNPNNQAHQASMDNRSDQMNPNNPAYGSSRGGKGR